jgi:hypothetical protein
MTARIDLPDATSEPEAYRDALCELIKDQDPLTALEQTLPVCRNHTVAVPAHLLHQAPEPGEWSVAEIVGHLFDVDIVYGFRWRMVLTAPNPTYPGYDEKSWARLPRLDFWQMMTAWEGLRASNLTLLRQTSRDQWTREGFHSEQGSETFELMVAKMAAHDLAHLNQLERAIQMVSASRTAGAR